jgi:hypothetical protein
MTKTRRSIMKATSLDGLANALDAARDKDLYDLGVDIAALPTFGGYEPPNTDRIWSWDQDRLLVSGENGGFKIVDRAEYYTSRGWDLPDVANKGRRPVLPLSKIWHPAA